MGRVFVLLRARLAGGRGEELPIAPLLMHGLIAGVLAWIARDQLPPFGYGTYVLTVVATLVTLPLLGEFSHLLRADPAQDWVAALPITERQLRIARNLHVFVVVLWLSLGSLVPAVALAPEGVTLGGQIALALGGFGLVLTLGACLLSAQALLGDRAEAVLVLLQTLLFIGAVVGFVMGNSVFPSLAATPALDDGGWTWIWPPAWFAASLGGGSETLLMPLAAFVASFVLLAAIPPARQTRSGRREPLLARLLRPVRKLGTRFWVRRDERAIFDLVYDALPLERDFVLRTYPMVGIPIAFVVAGSGGEMTTARSDLLAVLLFTACIYLPVLLMHVPVSESHRASWLLKTQGLVPGAVVGGTIKAVALRFLLPLYVALSALAWIEGGPHLVLRLALPGLLTSLLVLRMIYASTVTALPLSVALDRVESKFDWGGALMGVGLGLTIVAVLINRFLPSLAHGALLTAVLVAIEVVAERGQRARLG